MFKNGKFVGASLVSSLSLGVGSQFAMADVGTEMVSDEFSNFANLKCEQLERILNDVHWKAFDSDLARRHGDIEKSKRLKEEVEYLVKKYNLGIFLMYENDLTPYAALFDLNFCEDLDRNVNWVFGEKDSEIKKLVNLDAWYTKSIINSRDYLRLQKKNGNINIGDIISEKKNLVSKVTRRNVVRKLLALKVAKYGIKLEEKFLGSGKINKKSNVSIESSKSNVSSVGEEQSLVVAGASTDKNKDSSNWSFLDIVFGIKNKVKSFLGLKKEEKEFVSKEEDLKRESKRQETEFSLSLLVKRFLDAMRGEGKAEVKSENVQNENASNLLETTNLLTDGTESNQQ